MIIMINGAFGVGKTSVAKRLVAKLPNGMLYDPEYIGMMLRTMTEGIRSGEEDTDDFQDIKLWRGLTVKIAADLQQQYQRDLVMPMTLASKSYFEEIRAGLLGIDAALYHFCLTASMETIHARLENRGEEKGSWVFRQTARCLQAFETGEFKEYIETEEQNVEQIVEVIMRNVRA